MTEEKTRAEPGSRRPERRKKRKSRRKRGVETRKAEPDVGLNRPVLNSTENRGSIPEKPAFVGGKSALESSIQGGVDTVGQDDEFGKIPVSIAQNGLSIDPSKACTSTQANSPTITPPKTSKTPLGASRSSPPPNTETPPKSPRKMALLRQKQSADAVAEPDFVNELNEKKKARPSSSCVEAEDGKYSMLLASQNMDGKAQLFAAPVSQIVVYHEQLQNQRSQTSGTLLAHGEFEVFQLHNGDVTYLACGRSFVYPLLRKLKILQTSRNEFVLPLVNPERYWKIHVSASDMELRRFQQVLKSVVNFTNLAEDAKEVENLDKGRAHMQVKHDKLETNQSGEQMTDPNGKIDTDPNGKLNGGLKEGLDGAMCEGQLEGQSKEVTGLNGNHYTPFFSQIPESPPSVPVSPQQVSFNDTIDFPSLSLTKEARETANQSISSAMASFNLDSERTIKRATHPNLLLGQNIQSSARQTQNIQTQDVQNHNVQTQNVQTQNVQNHNVQNVQNPHTVSKPINHVNPFFQNYPKHGPNMERKKSTSSSSSMDSLLDEYEDNISTTQSIHYNVPRAGSRGTSYVSTARSGAIGHHRSGPMYQHSQSRFGSESKADDFPSTSLSQYEKNRQNSISGRSQKSSASELYSSVSNWMEPGRTARNLTHSKSIQSLATKKSFHRHSNFNNSNHSTSHNLPNHSTSHNLTNHPNPNSNLNETYREIYRSLTSHNLKHIVENEGKGFALSKSPSMVEMREGETTEKELRRGVEGRGVTDVKGHGAEFKGRGLQMRGRSMAELRDPSLKGDGFRGHGLKDDGLKGDGLSPAQVYKLLSERDEKPMGLRKLFGW